MRSNNEDLPKINEKSTNFLFQFLARKNVFYLLSYTTFIICTDNNV